MTRLFNEAPMWSRAVIRATDVIGFLGAGFVLAMASQSVRIWL